MSTLANVPSAQALSPLRTLWRPAVLDAIHCFVAQTGNPVFTRKQLIKRELDKIVHQTQSIGKTPVSTMDRVLQELVLEGKIERVVDGVYFCLHNPLQSYTSLWLAQRAWRVVTVHVVYVLAFLIITSVVASWLYAHFTV